MLYKNIHCLLDVTEVDQPLTKRQLCGGNPAAVQKMLQYGRQLHSMGEQLKREFGTNSANKKALLVGNQSSLLLFLCPFAYLGWRIEFSIFIFSGLLLLLCLLVSPSCIFL